MSTPITIAEFQALKASEKSGRSRARGCVPTIVDGIRFQSRKEARRWQELKLLEQAGAISELERQVRIALNVTNEVSGKVTKIGYYIADFQYFENGKKITEDAKGFKTDTYLWKARHVMAQYSVEIRET